MIRQLSVNGKTGLINGLAENAYPGTLDIIHFHQKGGDGDPFNDILMNRDNKIFTNSISSIRLITGYRFIPLSGSKEWRNIRKLSSSSKNEFR